VRAGRRGAILVLVAGVASVAGGSAAGVAAAAPKLRYDAPSRLVAYEQRACAFVDEGLSGAAGGGTANYRAAVDWEHVKVLATAIRRATGKTPRQVARDDRGRCTEAVPRLRARRLRFDFAAATRGARERFCVAVYNQNYEVDKARTTESERVYADLAGAYRRAAKDAGRPVKLESAAAVRRSCQA